MKPNAVRSKPLTLTAGHAHIGNLFARIRGDGPFSRREIALFMLIVVAAVYVFGVHPLRNPARPNERVCHAAGGGKHRDAARIARGCETVMRLLLYLVVTLRWWSVVAAFAVCLALPSACYGSGNLEELRLWASTLSVSTPALLTNVDNVSVLAFVTKWLGDPNHATSWVVQTKVVYELFEQSQITSTSRHGVSPLFVKECVRTPTVGTRVPSSAECEAE